MSPPPPSWSIPPAARCPTTPGPLTHAVGAIYAALMTEVQGEGWATKAMERAFCVHTLAILTGHVLALIVICGDRKMGGTCGAVPRWLAHGPPS